MNKRLLSWGLKNGFNEDGITYMVCGGNTYEIKDELKENGCKFNPLLKWHAPEQFELPEGFVFEELSLEDLYREDTLPKETARDYVLGIQAKYEKPSESNFIGAVGDKLVNIDATLVKVSGCNGYYGYTNIYTFACGKDMCVWFTTKDLNIDVNSKVTLSGTIKKHNEFAGDKTTQITRCKVEVAE